MPDTIQKQDSPVIVSDPADSLIASDSTLKRDTLAIPPQGDIETTIIYSAEDSIIMDVINKVVYLYGSATIDYGEISLSAAEIEINWGTSIMTARPALDSTGKKVGIPLFKDGPDMYVVEDYVKYNFKTKKGLSKGVITQQGEGYIHGNTIKKVDENLYINEALYTTCNLGHPHFFISAKKLKVIPEDKIVSGPFNLVISDVPTPLGFILGYFPIPKRQKSGIIFPTFGSSSRGFFLQQGGYYWAVNDYLGLKLLGDAYANGSFRTTLTGDYIKRYSFNGGFALNYGKSKFSFDEREGFNQDINVTWRHSTQSKRNSSFTANVNAGTNGFYKRNSYNPTTYQTGTFQSGILYYKIFGNSPFNMNIGVRQDQNINTRVVNFTLPEATIGMNRIYPFRRKNAVGPKRIYENINLGYTLNGRVTITNDSTRIGTDTVYSFNRKNLPFLLSKAQYGARHAIPVSTTFKFNKTFLKYFNMTPSFFYEEFWYAYKLKYEWDAANKVLVQDTVRGFTRTSSYNTSFSLSTTIYGMYKFNSKKLLGVRHTLIPSFGFAYKPDFTKGNYQEVQVDTIGNRRFLSNFAGMMYGTPSRGVNSNLTFNFTNSFEAKVASKKDTITGSKKFKLIDQLSLNGFYNFAAKNNPLSILNASARTRLLDRFDINTNAQFDPYALDSQGIRMNRYAVKEKQGLVRLINYGVSIGANLSPKQQTTKTYKTKEGTEEELRMINTYPEAYVDFSIPWTLFVNYNINYYKPTNLPGITSQALTFSGDLKLTEKWKIGFTSGYDLVLHTLTTTRMDIYRDLHCWQMALNISPFGPLRFYGFSINAKSSILQDLRLNKRSSSFYGGMY